MFRSLVLDKSQIEAAIRMYIEREKLLQAGDHKIDTVIFKTNCYLNNKVEEITANVVYNDYTS